MENALPDRIAHGFLEVAGLLRMPVGCVRCYGESDNHAGFTVFTEDEEACVYVQMYLLPGGETALQEELDFQIDKRKWGKKSSPDTLKLDIFPRDWTHQAFPQTPKRIVNLYRGTDRAVFIRYVGNSLREPLFKAFNSNVRFLLDAWHLDWMYADLMAPRDAYVAPAGTVNQLDLRDEKTAVRALFADAIAKFAAEQREQGGDLHDQPVTGIVVWFDLGNGHLSLHFDVRKPFRVDGSYSHDEYAAVSRTNWQQLFACLDEGKPVNLVGLNGDSTEIGPDDDADFAEPIGQLIVNVLRELRAEKAFAPLLLSPKAELIIESEDGYFWPSVKKGRGRDNRLG